jgi:hypothetical protein
VAEAKAGCAVESAHEAGARAWWTGEARLQAARHVGTGATHVSVKQVKPVKPIASPIGGRRRQMDGTSRMRQ